MTNPTRRKAKLNTKGSKPQKQKRKVQRRRPWYCAACDCVWMRKSGEGCCPNCGSEDIFIDEELICDKDKDGCGREVYGPHQRNQGDWSTPKGECTFCGYKGALKIKPYRKLFRGEKRKQATTPEEQQGSEPIEDRRTFGAPPNIVIPRFQPLRRRHT